MTLQLHEGIFFPSSDPEWMDKTLAYIEMKSPWATETWAPPTPTGPPFGAEWFGADQHSSTDYDAAGRETLATNAYDLMCTEDLEESTAEEAGTEEFPTLQEAQRRSQLQIARRQQSRRAKAKGQKRTRKLVGKEADFDGMAGGIGEATAGPQDAMSY